MSTGDEIQAHQFQTPKSTSTSNGGNDGGDFNALMMTMELEFTRPQVGQVLVQNGKHEDVDAKKMHGVMYPPCIVYSAPRESVAQRT